MEAAAPVEIAGGNEVVIRFPPVAASPFAAPAARREAPPREPAQENDESFDVDSREEFEESPSLDVVAPLASPPRDELGPNATGFVADEMDDDIEPPDDDDAAAAHPPMTPEAERRLSPSQRRRLRRKRRREALRDQTAGSGNGHTAPPAPGPRAPRAPRPDGHRDREGGEGRRGIPQRPPHRPEADAGGRFVEDRETTRGPAHEPPDIDEPVGGFEPPEPEDFPAPTDENPADGAARPPATPDARRDRDDDGGRRGGRRRRGRRGGRRGRRFDERQDHADSRSPDDRQDRPALDIESDRDEEPVETSDVEADEGDFEDRHGEETMPAAIERDEPEAEPAEVELEDEEPAAEGPVHARRQMIINVVPREECRIAILKDGRLEEIYIERASSENHVGNIYKGRVTNVEPSIQAAFLDFGLGKNGFLHISDLHPKYFPNRSGDSEDIGHKTPRRDRPPIQRCLRRGQELLVQIIKEGIGTKGPTLSTYLSIPGRFLVMLPGMSRAGVSRKIEDPDIRDKLRGQMNELELPGDMGFIARTAAVDRNKRELQNDLNYLTRLWRSVEQRVKHDRAPAEVYRESDLVIRTIRDVFSSDIAQIVVDEESVAEHARQFLSIFSPRSRDSVVVYSAKEPIFHKYGIEAELERLHSRHVPLKSGGSLVIDSTEALVAIDVNSGRFRDEDDAETTAFKINVEAANEVPRQLRLRDLGGVIICDFIDMRLEKHRREIERILIRNLKEHKERAKVLKMSRFGIIEMTRQRQRASLTRNVYQDCHHCRGTGLVKTVESVALDVMRLVQLAATREHITSIEVVVSPEVALLLQNRKRAAIHALEAENRRNISIRPDPHFGLDQVQMNYLDPRGRLVPNG